MNWIKVRSLKADKILDAMPPDWDGAWDTAEKYMRAGYLPPYWLCRVLPAEHLESFTRRRQWVLSAALETLNRMEDDTAGLRKTLKAMKRQYRGGLTA